MSMKLRNICITVFLLTASSAGVVSAQESDISKNYHPFLSDNFYIGLGAYRPDQTRRLGAQAGGADGSLDESQSQSTGIFNFRWRFTKNWHFQTTYWATDSGATTALNENFEFESVTFEQGSFIKSEIDTSIARLFWGRSFFRKPNHDWGVGAGIHWTEIDAFVEGQVVTSPPISGTGPIRREGASVSAPLPNLGIWYIYSWSPKWVLVTRLDWLKVTIDEFSGSMYDASVGLNYQMSDHFGIGLAVNAFRLDVEVNSDEWRGGLLYEQVGPLLNITWNW
jgi:hypothetical protein